MEMGQTKISKKKEFLTCRKVLWCLVFCGFAINYMLRINLNLTIVAMVMPRSQAAATVQCQEENFFSPHNATRGINETISKEWSTTPFPENIIHEQRFAWTESQQGMALGAYYWLHWLSQLPGGILARRYGTKLVYGLGNFLTAIIGFLIPFMTRYHLYALVFLRILQGLVAGVVWPSMHNMTAKWIPPNERSRFVSSYLGSSVGAAITYPLCAAVSSSFGWGAAFYVTSVLGVIWYGFWLFLVYDSPQQHPRISEDEKRHILETLEAPRGKKKAKIPWKSIFLSGPVWVTIAAHWGAAWGFLTLMTQAPSYFNYVHGWDIKATGFLSGAPHILRTVFSYVFSTLSDWLIRTKKMSLTNVRKLAAFVCTGVQGILILILGYSGCHPIMAVIFMIMGTAVNGAVSSSSLANLVDLSPNYASILLGFCGMVVICCGFISPAVVGFLTNNNQTVEQWRLVFIIAAVNSIASAVIYLLFGTSQEQSWNYYEIKEEKAEREMQKLTTTRVEISEELVDKSETLKKETFLQDKEKGDTGEEEYKNSEQY